MVDYLLSLTNENFLIEIKKDNIKYYIIDLNKKGKPNLNEDEKFLIKKFKTEQRRFLKEKKKINKMNRWEKQLQNANNRINKLNDSLINSSKLFCMDLEFHESSKVITEIGIAIWENNDISCYHFVVKEHYELRNGINVQDNKDNFMFGKSIILPLIEIEKEVFRLGQNIDFLVGHAFQNDINFLNQSGLFNLPLVLDTQSYAKAHFKQNQRLSLKSIIEKEFKLNIENLALHNGGNDAYWTLKSLLSMGKIL